MASAYLGELNPAKMGAQLLQLPQLHKGKAVNGKPKLCPNIVGNISIWDYSYWSKPCIED